MDATAFKPGTPHEYMADGTHQGVVRWWLERIPGVPAPWLTMQCSSPAGSWNWSGELPGASSAAVRRKIEAVMVEEGARAAAKAARKAKKG